MIAALFVFLLLLLLGAMTAAVWMWTQGAGRPRYMPIVAVLSVALLTLVNLVYGHILVSLLLGGFTLTWAKWVWELEPPSRERFAEWRRRRAQKARDRRRQSSATANRPWPAQGTPQAPPRRALPAPEGFRAPRTGTAPPLDPPPTGTSLRRRWARRRPEARSPRPSGRLWRALRH